MAREYQKDNRVRELASKRQNIIILSLALVFSGITIASFGIGNRLSPWSLYLIAGLIPAISIGYTFSYLGRYWWIEKERSLESQRRNNSEVIGQPPNRQCFSEALKDARKRGKVMIDKYLVGFEVDSGDPIWVTDEEICSHGCVFAKTGVGKTLWLEGLMFQQMARGRASGLTFIDAKRDPGTLADIIMMALMTGRIEDVVVVDPFDPVCAYNFVFTTQRADVKARKVLRCGLPPTSDQSTTKHYDRLAADAVYRVVRAMESLGLAWSVRDIAVALSAFTVAYPRMRSLLHEKGAKQAMVELGHLASSYRTAKGSLDSARLTDNLRGIASELHSISNSEAGEMFCTPRADLSLTDAIRRGKIIYYMLPRLEEAESAARMVKVFREDLEVSIGEITSSRGFRLEDPHLVIIDEGASTFGPTWANLFELARKGRFALLFGAQSVGGLMDTSVGLSEQFYERVIANVNLKVIMRLGDNRTAMDMSEWIGKIVTQKKSIATAASVSVNARELTKSVEINRRSSDGFRDGLTISDDEEDLVSPEELKHEMSAEKGLAWFDKGDGRLRKGRSIWFDAKLPAEWDGREHLVRYDAVEADEIGLAEWVDEHILSVERAETEKELELKETSNSPEPTKNTEEKEEAKKEEPAEEQGGSFRLNMMKGFRGMNRSRTAILDNPKATTPQVKEEEGQQQDKTPPAPKETPKETKEDSNKAPKEEKAPPTTKKQATSPLAKTAEEPKAPKENTVSPKSPKGKINLKQKQQPSKKSKQPSNNKKGSKPANQKSGLVFKVKGNDTVAKGSKKPSK